VELGDRGTVQQKVTLHPGEPAGTAGGDQKRENRRRRGGLYDPTKAGSVKLGSGPGGKKNGGNTEKEAGTNGGARFFSTCGTPPRQEEAQTFLWCLAGSPARRVAVTRRRTRGGAMTRPPGLGWPTFGACPATVGRGTTVGHTQGAVSVQAEVCGYSISNGGGSRPPADENGQLPELLRQSDEGRREFKWSQDLLTRSSLAAAQNTDRRGDGDFTGR